MMTTNVWLKQVSQAFEDLFSKSDWIENVVSTKAINRFFGLWCSDRVRIRIRIRDVV